MVNPPQPVHVAEQNIQAVRQLQDRAQRQRTRGERFSDAIADVAARESTIFAHVGWFALWVLVNTDHVKWVRPFDPYPFTLLTTLVSLEAIFLTLFVLASQSRMTHEADRRAHLDLQVDVLAEQEMTMVLRMLKELCDHFQLQHTTSSAGFAELVRHTDLMDLADRLDAQLSPGEKGGADLSQS